MRIPSWFQGRRPPVLRRRYLMLRTRITVAIVATVAITTLAITVVAFAVVSGDLKQQLRNELQSRDREIAAHVVHHFDGRVPTYWVPSQPTGFGTATRYVQLLSGNGRVRSSVRPYLLPVTSAAIQVAQGKRGWYFSETTIAGTHALVLTAPLARDYAVQLAVPLTTVDKARARVGAALGVLSLLGVVAAAVSGWAVARGGLVPVGRLARVAEEVTATGDPSRRVEVDRPDELGRLAASFNTMLAGLQNSLDAQRRLVSDASHELRTPLTSMRLNIELLAENPDLPEPERREVLDRVAAQGAELSRLVAAITELARGERPAGEHVEVRLDEIVAGCLAAARRDWPGMRFRAEIVSCVVSGSPERLRSAIRNLLDNAAKFSPPGGPVELWLAGGVITVRDHGPGFAPADLPRVFDRFYRSAAARSVPGSGLGLAIVRQVAGSHGGTVSARNAADGGAVLTLRLPPLPER